VKSGRLIRANTCRPASGDNSMSPSAFGTGGDTTAAVMPAHIPRPYAVPCQSPPV